MSVLADSGYIQVHAYTSYAQIPLQDVAVSISDVNGDTIALRLTNRDGLFDIPVAIQVPDLSTSQAPNPGAIPFATVNLYARYNGYEAIEIENLQVFADTTTLQNLEMIPLSELPRSWNEFEQFVTPPQNL